MKKMFALTLIGVLACAGFASATDLALTVNRLDSNTGVPATIEFEIIGTLSSDTDNEGLAAFGFDLSATLGGAPLDLETAATVVGPTLTEMEAFVIRGLTNPAGYGGTPVLIDPNTPALGKFLKQIGAAQDTIGNNGNNAPFPYGPVETGVGFTSIVLAIASVDVTEEGTYVFTIDSGFANVIDEGEAGPVFKVVAAANVTGATLEVTLTAANPCPFDLDGNGSVGPGDVGIVKANFGCNVADPACAALDFDGNGSVGPGDVGIVKANFGPCP
jgi:hypothetical protein